MTTEVFIGSFLGFVSALATAWIVRYVEDRMIAKSVIAAIIEEAKTNLSRLDSHPFDDYAFLGLFDRMAWSAAISSNEIGVVRSQETVRLAAGMYHRLDVLEKWNAIRVQTHVLGSNVGPTPREIDAVVAESRKLAQKSLRVFLETPHE